MSTASKSKFIINIVYYSIIAVIIYIIFKFLFAYLLPFIIGTVITVLVQMPAAAISNKTKIRKGNCALLLVVLIYVTLFCLISFLIFKAGKYVYDFTLSDNQIILNISKAVDETFLEVKKVFSDIPEFVTSQISNAFKNLLSSIADIMTDFAKSVVRATPMFLTSSLVTIIASCYIAKDYDRFKISIKSVLSDKIIKTALTIRKVFKDNITKIVFGYLKILLITFLELSIGLFLLGKQNFILYGFLISILDLLPIFGAGTVLIPWGIYSILTANYFFGSGLLILYVIIIIVRNIIEPRIIGKQIGLHPLLALISVFIGLKLFGIIGIFILPFSVMLLYKLYEKGVFEMLFNDDYSI